LSVTCFFAWCGRGGWVGFGACFACSPLCRVVFVSLFQFLRCSAELPERERRSSF
jgi:hypothetical protein